MPDDGEASAFDERGATGMALKLLVASPTLADPNFARAVILLLEHSEEGALGLVLNRPGGVPVGEILEQWQEQADLAPPGVVFVGGPVSRDAVIGLARREDRADDASDESSTRYLRVAEGVYTVDLAVPPTAQPVPLSGVRLFSGYAGWGSGQLEEELGEGAWFVLDPEAGDLMTSDPDRLWHDVLMRQKPKLAMLAGYPSHVHLN